MLDVEYDRETGGIKAITIRDDEYKMNWCESDSAVWGVPYFNARVAFNRIDPLHLVSFSEGSSVYENALVRVTVNRRFKNRETFQEEYIFENIADSHLFVGKGQFGIFTPFNDNYDAAEYCLTNKCHTHIFTGGKSSWVCALRMGSGMLGLYEKNLGLILTKGSLDCYRQWLPPYAKNDRGDIMLCAEAFDLAPGEKYTLSWENITHTGKNDFVSLIKKYGLIFAEAKFETLFEGESLEVELSGPAPFELSDDDRIYNQRLDSPYFSITPQKLGEGKLKISNPVSDITVKFFVSPPLDTLVEKRVLRICRDQQFIKPGHPLDGAYLIFDNESKTKYFSNKVSDHNASRERIGMGILVAKHLQTYKGADRDYEDNSLRLYEEFVLREFVDPETGDVFDTIGRDPSQIRLYNAPWVCVFMCELYRLRGEKRYLEIASRVMEKYYKGGGDHFYPNAFSPAEPIILMREAGLSEKADRLFNYVCAHAENIINNKIDYPKHEVDYEQTIVAPALTILLQMYTLTGEIRYLRDSSLHFRLLKRFNGFQPDYRLNETAIRHWDDYWFGKSAMFGDTFPHYWSVLSGWCYYLMYRVYGDEFYKAKAEKSARNCLCLFDPDGGASCAYVYPYMINDKKGEFYDAWANDQDFALYYAIKILKGE